MIFNINITESFFNFFGISKIKNYNLIGKFETYNQYLLDIFPEKIIKNKFKHFGFLEIYSEDKINTSIKDIGVDDYSDSIDFFDKNDKEKFYILMTKICIFLLNNNYEDFEQEPALNLNFDTNSNGAILNIFSGKSFYDLPLISLPKIDEKIKDLKIEFDELNLPNTYFFQYIEEYNKILKNNENQKIKIKI